MKSLMTFLSIFKIIAIFLFLITLPIFWKYYLLIVGNQVVKAKIIAIVDESGRRSHDHAIYYYAVGNQALEGKIWLTGIKLGDSVCIQYSDFFPSVSLPLYTEPNTDCPN